MLGCAAVAGAGRLDERGIDKPSCHRRKALVSLRKCSNPGAANHLGRYRDFFPIA